LTWRLFEHSTNPSIPARTADQSRCRRGHIGNLHLIRVPAPALFLLVAAAAADLAPSLGGLSIWTDQLLVTIALVVILFEGGAQIGWTRLRPNAAAVVWLGVAGTAVTAAATAALAHWLFGFDWRAALLLGAALAPTDPAVVFSVLGNREITGRSGTLLEGESGANDPVGIAVMVSLLAADDASWSSFGAGTGRFALQMGVGTALGLLGGLLLSRLVRRLDLPIGVLYLALTMAGAGVLYVAAAALHGSGFLAVFLAGIVVGDVREPLHRAVARFAGVLAGAAEVLAFVVLGLSVEFSALFTGNQFWVALGVAGLLVIVVRPALVGLLLVPVRLPRGERLFVLFAGLKGAVPILLGTYVLVEGVPRGGEIYHIVFVVVLVSVIVQGGLVPAMTRAWKVPMRGTN
jgi:cell volume regulation protein A